MEYLTVKDASKKWGVTEQTIRKWCQNGEFKVILQAEKVGGKWRIPADAPRPKKKK